MLAGFAVQALQWVCEGMREPFGVYFLHLLGTVSLLVRTSGSGARACLRRHGLGTMKTGQHHMSAIVNCRVFLGILSVLCLAFLLGRTYRQRVCAHLVLGDMDLNPETGQYRLSADVAGVEVNALRQTLAIPPMPFPLGGAVRGVLHVTGPLEAPVFSGAERRGPTMRDVLTEQYTAILHFLA